MPCPCPKELSVELSLFIDKRTYLVVNKFTWFSFPPIQAIIRQDMKLDQLVLIRFSDSFSSAGAAQKDVSASTAGHLEMD